LAKVQVEQFAIGGGSWRFTISDSSSYENTREEKIKVYGKRK